MESARRLACLIALALVANCPAQTAPNDNLFATVKTQITVRVSKHPTGADLVELTALDSDYPAETLRSQAEKICTAIGSPARGLQVFRESIGTAGNLNFLKATFGTSGILNGADGIRLQAIARAFAGGAGHAAVQGIDVIISGVAPQPNTLGRFVSPEVVVQGLPPAGTVLEYRIKLISQNPEAIVIPDKSDPQPQKAKSAGGARGFGGPIVWLLVAIGALAIGAIVYNLALRSPPRTGRRSGSVHK